MSGTLSGAIGVTLVLKVLGEVAGNRELVLGTALMTACIAALVVVGKAYGKVIAIEQSTEIMFRAGQLLACIDRFLPFDLLARRKRRGTRRRNAKGTPPTRRQ